MPASSITSTVVRVVARNPGKREHRPVPMAQDVDNDIAKLPIIGQAYLRDFVSSTDYP